MLETGASDSMCRNMERDQVLEAVASDSMNLKQHVLEVVASGGMRWRTERTHEQEVIAADCMTLR